MTMFAIEKISFIARFLHLIMTTQNGVVKFLQNHYQEFHMVDSGLSDSRGVSSRPHVLITAWEGPRATPSPKSTPNVSRVQDQQVH